MNALSIEKKQVVITNSTVTDNEAAFEFWENNVFKVYPKKESHYSTVTFKYEVPSPRTILDKILFRYPTHTAQFTTSHIFGTVWAKKGKEINGRVVDLSFISIYITNKDESRFYEENPGFIDNPRTNIRVAFDGNKMRSCITILFSDIIAMTFIEI